MGAHEWVDIAGYVFAGATGLLSTFLGYRLVRHDQERKTIQDSLREHDRQLAEHQAIIDIIKGTFKFK